MGTDRYLLRKKQIKELNVLRRIIKKTIIKYIKKKRIKYTKKVN